MGMPAPPPPQPGPGRVARPILLRGLSRDRRWVFFSIESQGSASIAADGSMLDVRARNGHGTLIRRGRGRVRGYSLGYYGHHDRPYRPA